MKHFVLMVFKTWVDDHLRPSDFFWGIFSLLLTFHSIVGLYTGLVLLGVGELKFEVQWINYIIFT